jgi:hypothetical protein
MLMTDSRSGPSRIFLGLQRRGFELQAGPLKQLQLLRKLFGSATTAPDPRSPQPDLFLSNLHHLAKLFGLKGIPLILILL